MMKSMLFLLAFLWSLKGLILVAWWVENVRYMRRLRRMRERFEGQSMFDRLYHELYWDGYAPLPRVPEKGRSV